MKLELKERPVQGKGESKQVQGVRVMRMMDSFLEETSRKILTFGGFKVVNKKGRIEERQGREMVAGLIDGE